MIEIESREKMGKELIVTKKNNLFTKVKRFFGKIFSKIKRKKEDIKEKDNYVKINIDKKEDTFKNSIKFSEEERDLNSLDINDLINVIQKEPDLLELLPEEKLDILIEQYMNRIFTNTSKIVRLKRKQIKN